jgi:hypothetical protein
MDAGQDGTARAAGRGAATRLKREKNKSASTMGCTRGQASSSAEANVMWHVRGPAVGWRRGDHKYTCNVA